MKERLPIDEHLAGVVEMMRGHGAGILIATPGAGKTTRVAPALLAGGVAGKILMLQPRRVAARASAQRIAEENGWELGREVGYHIRFEKRYGAATRIGILTEAILTRMLLDDPYLEGEGEGVGMVILDEFHERSIHADLAVALLREIQETVRPELKVLVMSATLDAGPLAGFLGDAPVMRVEGRTHGLEVLYRPAAESGRLMVAEGHLGKVVEEAVGEEGAGDVLVFLPGRGEIERAGRALGHMDAAIVALHGSLSAEEQQRALRPDGAGRRKIILATNIAETSLTIDGVRTVIDTGLARVASFDADRGMDRLDLARISAASATQRAGRAARQGPGRVYRLWSAQQQNHLAAFEVADIHRIDLAPTLLGLHGWTQSPETFGWFDAPAEERVAAGERLLRLLGALDEKGLTAVGREMQRLPVHPRLGRLLTAARGTGLEEEAISLATVLSDERGGRVLGELTVPAELRAVRDQIARVMKTTEGTETTTVPRDVGDLLLLAYPDRVARRREGGDGFSAVMVGKVGLRIAVEGMTGAVADTALFLALDAHHDPKNRRAEAVVRRAIPVEEAALVRLFPGEVRTESTLVFDEGKGKVAAVTRRWFADLMLAEDPHGRVDSEAAGVVLAEALRGRARELFEGDEAARRVMARMELVRQAMPEAGVPELSEEMLAGLLREACAGKRAVSEVRESGALAEALRGALEYPLDRRLEEWAPEAVEVPTGNRIRLEYGLPAVRGGAVPAPVLAVRLQELFGLMDTPRIANGRVAVLLHLLSPGYKAMQITQDLRSFWGGAYFEVRKDLRVRYPKHKWPEDPLTAAPEAKGRSRR